MFPFFQSINLSILAILFRKHTVVIKINKWLWTETMQRLLHEDKCKYMVFNTLKFMFKYLLKSDVHVDKNPSRRNMKKTI